MSRLPKSGSEPIPRMTHAHTNLSIYKRGSTFWIIIILVKLHNINQHLEMELNNLEADIETKKTKLEKAKYQISLLDVTIEELKTRSNHAKDDQKESFLKQLELKLYVLGGTRNMYLQYVQRTQVTLEKLHYQLMEAMFDGLEEVDAL